MQIKRSDKQYTDVETFEEYEFTSCIAYEMMIRNPRVIEITRYKLKYPNGKNGKRPSDAAIPPYTDEDEDFFFYGMPDFFYFDYHFFRDLIDRKSYIVENRFNQVSNTDGKITTFIEHDGFIRSTLAYNDGDVPTHFEQNTIIRHFKRPEVAVYEIENDVEVILDLSKSENELISYIKHLKKAHDKGIVKNPYDEFVNVIPKAMSSKTYKGSVMADILYVYDALRLGYSRKKIQMEVYNYYADKGIETRTLDYKTLKKYHNFAIDYIEHKRYLELATGKKLEDLKLGTLLN